uniref:Uncharacterized protein n=1 Tax=viral metagenome TaxID=1070528 RepID=A0A6M3LTZ2_9ZZZZ
MYVCKKCHKEDERKYGCLGFDIHLKETGPCEICGENTIVVDCKAYKKFEN